MISLCFYRGKWACTLLQDASARGGGGVRVSFLGVGSFLLVWEMVHSPWIQYLFIFDFWDDTEMIRTNIACLMVFL